MTHHGGDGDLDRIIAERNTAGDLVRRFSTRARAEIHTDSDADADALMRENIADIEAWIRGFRDMDGFRAAVYLLASEFASVAVTVDAVWAHHAGGGPSLSDRVWSTAMAANAVLNEQPTDPPSGRG